MLQTRPNGQLPFLSHSSRNFQPLKPSIYVLTLSAMSVVGSQTTKPLKSQHFIKNFSKNLRKIRAPRIQTMLKFIQGYNHKQTKQTIPIIYSTNNFSPPFSHQSTSQTELAMPWLPSLTPVHVPACPFIMPKHLNII